MSSVESFGLLNASITSARPFPRSEVPLLHAALSPSPTPFPHRICQTQPHNHLESPEIGPACHVATRAFLGTPQPPPSPEGSLRTPCSTSLCPIQTGTSPPFQVMKSMDTALLRKKNHRQMWNEEWVRRFIERKGSRRKDVRLEKTGFETTFRCSFVLNLITAFYSYKFRAKPLRLCCA